MKRIATTLLSLCLLYLLATLLAEVLLANYAATATPHDWVHTSCSAIHRSVQLLVQLRLAELHLVDVSLWVLNNRLHLLLFPLAVLAAYYFYKEKHLERPAIGKNAPLLSDYEQQKTEETRREVEKLQNSKEYQEYQWKKKNGHLKDNEDDLNGIDWEKGEQEIYDD